MEANLSHSTLAYWFISTSKGCKYTASQSVVVSSRSGTMQSSDNAITALVREGKCDIEPCKQVSKVSESEEFMCTPRAVIIEGLSLRSVYDNILPVRSKSRGLSARRP